MNPAVAMIIVWATAGVAWMEWSLRSVIQVPLIEMMIMIPATVWPAPAE